MGVFKSHNKKILSRNIENILYFVLHDHTCERKILYFVYFVFCKLFTICIQKYGVDTKILGDIFTIREQNVKKGMI